MIQLNDIPSVDWVSVNDLATISIGSEVTIYLKGIDWVYVQQSVTKPSISDKSGHLLTNEYSGYAFVNIPAQGEEVWVRASSDTSIIVVQEGKGISLNSYGTGIDPRLYTGLQGLTIQPFTEANVKNGTQFTISEEIPIPQASIVYRAFKTPNDGRDILIKTRIINTDGGMRYTPHTSQTGVVQGADKTDQIVNLNAKSSNTSGCQYYEVLSTTDDGPFFDVVRSAVGSGNNAEQGIFSGLGIERVLIPDTEYLLKFENLDTNTDIYVVYSITFYSGPLSVDIV